MKKLFILLFILCVSVYAQDRPKFQVYYGQTLAGQHRTDFAIGVPILNDNLYYAFYFTKVPGLRLEYRFFNCLYLGFSIRDNKNNYFGTFNYGLKMTNRFRLGLSVTRSQPVFDFVVAL